MPYFLIYKSTGNILVTEPKPEWKSNFFLKHEQVSETRITPCAGADLAAGVSYSSLPGGQSCPADWRPLRWNIFYLYSYTNVQCLRLNKA